MSQKHYQDGYRHGEQDAKEGRLWKENFRYLTRSFQPGTILYGGEGRHQDYRKGYRQGAEDTVRIIHTSFAPPVVQKTSTPNLSHHQTGTNMSRTIEDDLELIEDLKKKIESFLDDIEELHRSYTEAKQALEDSDATKNYVQYLQNNIFSPADGKGCVDIIKELIDQITNIDLPVSKEVIDNLEKQITFYRRRG